MTKPLKGRIETAKAYDQQDRLIGYISRRVGHCGHIHEGHGTRENHSRVNLWEAIANCQNCQKAALQPQPAGA